MSSDDDDVYDFQEQLNFGKKWEERVRPYLERYLNALIMENIAFEDEPETQRAGIDIRSELIDPDVDVKTYSHKYITEDTLFIEVLSVMEREVPGWFYDGEFDLMVVIGENKAGTAVYKRGWLVLMQTGIRDWFDEAVDSHDWDFARVPNTDYHTGGYWVPVEDIPSEFVFSFDPRPPSTDSMDERQKELDKWTDGGVSNE